MKGKTLISLALSALILVGCGTGNTSSSSSNSSSSESSSSSSSTDSLTSSTNSTNSVTENAVKIKSINAKETEVEIANVKARNRKNANNTEDLNYIIITRPQTDITFTITLDNPEAYGIDALRVYCDDEDAQIQVDGEFKPIAQESDGTRVINWSSEDPYTKTYNIRTTSEDAINTFKVVDVRLAGHDKFQSKETNSTDLGNNELHIYKMDEDAYTLNVIENTFDYIKFNFNVKDEYKDIISNIKVDGLEMDEELGYWTLNESKEIEVSYEYYLEEYDLKVERSDRTAVYPMNISKDVNAFNVIDSMGIWTVDNGCLIDSIEFNEIRFLMVTICSLEIIDASVSVGGITYQTWVYPILNDTNYVIVVENAFPKEILSQDPSNVVIRINDIEYTPCIFSNNDTGFLRITDMINVRG